MSGLRYPEAPRGDTAEVLHGVEVADPYRELEDPHSPKTRAWIDAENALTQAFLAKSKRRAALRQRLGEISDYPRQSPPSRRGGRWFLYKNSGLENQDRLYWRREFGGEEQELLNPNELSSDGTAALLQASVSPDGRHAAYQVSRSGSDWAEIRVRAIDTKQDLPDLVEWVKFSGVSWSPDGQGFYYSRYDAPVPGSALQSVNLFQKLFYHALGTKQADDRLVHAWPNDGELGVDGQVTEDGRFLVLSGWKGSSPMQLVHVIDLAKPTAGPRELIGEFIAGFHFVGSEGSELFFKTTLEADRGRVVAMDALSGRASLREIIPERDATLEAVHYVGSRFVTSYLVDGAHELSVHDRTGKRLFDVPLPGVGCVNASGTEQTSQELCFAFESLTTPPTIFALNVADGKVTCLHKARVQFDPERFETRRVFFESRDGTRIPLFLAHKKGLVLDGANPTLLYGYGGFNVPVLPWFRSSRIGWMETGGIYASACLRGGNEYGEAWHRGGIKEQKQNVFDDFIAAAEWLIREKYTRPSRLAINGGSNGGLLVGACMTQRPELFGAVVAAVGVFDMLRFHKFTIGWAWTSDYGNPDDAKDFAVLKSYSPLHNVKKGVRYPATLITTGDHDDRVVPAHSFKFAATLQAAQGGEAPVLIRIETKTGHGQGKPITKLLDETADIYAFLGEVLGMTSLP